jgi:hypothetical protein
MITDKNLYLSEDQAITASAASTEYIDLGAAGDAIGRPMQIAVNCTADFNTLTSLTIALQCHEDSGFSTGTKTIASASVALAQLVDNTRVAVITIPPSCERYIRMYYTVVGSNPSTGKLTSFVTSGVPVGEVADA